MKVKKALWAVLLANILLATPTMAANNPEEPSPTKKKFSNAVDKFDSDVKQGAKNVKEKIKNSKALDKFESDVKQGAKNVKEELKKLDKKISE